MKCILCGSKHIEYRETKISDFLVARIYGMEKVDIGIPVNICHCLDCTFAFYDKRLTDEEEVKLYSNYREYEYQKQREKYDCWYTKKVNDALNHDKKALKEQQRVIKKMIDKNISKKIKNGLDYGGNKGETFCDELNIKNKFVYDISNVETVKNVKSISNYNELKNYKFDFIMCNMTLEHISNPIIFVENLYKIGTKGTYYYVEVPSENPYYKNKFSLLKNFFLLFNTKYNKFKLAKHYFKVKKEPFMPMSEHVNFFTVKSIKKLFEKCGYDILDVQENIEKNVLGKNVVLSIMCKK